MFICFGGSGDTMSGVADTDVGEKVEPLESVDAEGTGDNVRCMPFINFSILGGEKKIKAQKSSQKK